MKLIHDNLLGGAGSVGALPAAPVTANHHAVGRGARDVGEPCPARHDRAAAGKTGEGRAAAGGRRPGAGGCPLARGGAQAGAALVRPVREAGSTGVAGQAQAWTAPDSLSAAQRVLLIGLACRPPREADDSPLPCWSQTDLRDAFVRQPWGEPVGVRTIGRILDEAQLQPHRQLYWCTSRDPRYEEKLLDVVRLYLQPPSGASVLSIDIKTCIQALGRKHPDIPMQPGIPLRRDFEYVRHGIVDLFASFNVRTGQVLGGTFDRHRHEEFIQFMEQVAFHHRQGEVHCILDNASYYTHPDVRRWLDRHDRFVFHFTPTHASWLNQIECWFSILGRKLLRRSVFNSKAELRAAIVAFIERWNAQAHPFNWAYGEELLHDQRLAA